MQGLAPCRISRREEVHVAGRGADVGDAASGSERPRRKALIGPEPSLRKRKGLGPCASETPIRLEPRWLRIGCYDRRLLTVPPCGLRRSTSTQTQDPAKNAPRVGTPTCHELAREHAHTTHRVNAHMLRCNSFVNRTCGWRRLGRRQAVVVRVGGRRHIGNVGELHLTMRPPCTGRRGARERGTPES